MNLNLRDIKPNVEIVDYEWWIFITFVILLTLILIYFIYKYIKNRKKVDIALLKLKNLDFENPKKTAYEFSRYAKEFLNENNKKLFEEIEKELVKYKYKPDVPPLSREIKEKISEFIRDLK